MEWSFSGKSKIEGLLDILRMKNHDLYLLRTQNAPLQELQNRTQLITTKSKGLGTFALAIRDAANRLYDGFSTTAVCPCHYVNLRLQHLEDINPPPLKSSGKSQTANFHFIITTNAKTRDTEFTCTYLAVHSELHSVNAPHQSQFEINGVGGKMEIISNTIPQHSYKKQNNPASAAGKINLWPISRASMSRSIAVRTEQHIPAINPGTLPELTPDITTIQNLCAHLRGFQLRANFQTKECLGIIQSTADTTKGRHLIYQDPPTHSMTSRVTLPSIFERADKQSLFPLNVRFKIAFVLSLSLIYFGSYPNSWFRDRWRTRDIYFFLSNQNDSPAPDSTMIPYIATSFQRPVKSKAPEITPTFSTKPTSSRPRAGLARNERFFSLALALIEIAFGDSIFNIKEPSELLGGNGNEYVEYIKAKSIVDSSLLASVMGPAYARVVKLCFYCDFGIGEEDLSKREVQDIYYEKVVCELEGCLESLESSEVDRSNNYFHLSHSLRPLYVDSQ